MFDQRYDIVICALVHVQAKVVVRELKKQGVEVWMITGDNERTAYAVAKDVCDDV